MPHELIVDGGHLRQGLRWYQKTRKVRPSNKALISFDGSFAVVEALDRGFVAQAWGQWPGTAKVGATLIVALAKAPPSGEGVHITYADGKLRLGSLTVACSWEPVSVSMMRIPATPDWIQALSLKYRFPRDRIKAEGLAPSISAAEHQLDALIARCAKSLAPLHITAADLRELIERRLIERAVAERDDGVQ